MNRCTHRPPARRWPQLALAGSLLIALTPWAQAQSSPRSFPEAALRAQMVVLQPPRISLDGEPAQLSPGARIRSVNNTIVLSASLVGQQLTVNYVRESLGLVHDVWILSPSEATQKRPGANSKAAPSNLRLATEPPAHAFGN